MAATDKIARQIRLGQSEDFDLANYDTTRVGRAFVHPHRCPPSVSTLGVHLTAIAPCLSRTQQATKETPVHSK